MSVRLAHLSDIHITTLPLEWQREDWFNKRLPGWLNFRVLGRGHRFRHADMVLAALVSELKTRKPHHIVFSGDATAMGFEGEFAKAAALLQLSHPDMPPGLAVPGNHDYYTPTSAPRGHFERHFAPWLAGERIGNETYPFAQRVGPMWLVGVNSCTGNRWAWDAGGSVDAAQLERLAALLARLDPGPRILVTHYPVALASGKPEARTHGLRNVRALVDVAAKGGVVLWLHGHRHGHFRHAAPSVAPFPVVCVGSSTQHGLWGCNEYHIEGKRCHAARLVYSPEQAGFREIEHFDLDLPL